MTPIAVLSSDLWGKNEKSPMEFIGPDIANGGKDQDRTGDTRIFNPLLYQLSYPATEWNLIYTSFTLFQAESRKKREKSNAMQTGLNEVRGWPTYSFPDRLHTVTPHDRKMMSANRACAGPDAFPTSRRARITGRDPVLPVFPPPVFPPRPTGSARRRGGTISRPPPCPVPRPIPAHNKTRD